MRRCRQEMFEKDMHYFSITVNNELYRKISYYALEHGFSRKGAVIDVLEKALAGFISVGSKAIKTESQEQDDD